MGKRSGGPRKKPGEWEGELLRDDVSRILLGPNTSVTVTDHTGRGVNLSEFGTLQSGEIAEKSLEVTPIQPPVRQYRPVSYRISFTFEQDPQGEEALGQMAAPLTVECAILQESGETKAYTLTDAWLEFVENRTIAFGAREMTRR